MAMCVSPSSSTTSANSTTTVASKQKKTVTFKNILETSDDKSAVKKFYNPDNRIPLVSIMKKECMERHTLYSRNSATIVRPSRLTEILKNNSNIDKLNALKFRSSTAASTLTSGTASTLFGAGLSRAFGAPASDEEEDNQVTFRLNKAPDSDEDEPEKITEENDAAVVVGHQQVGKEVKAALDDHAEEEDEQQMIVDKRFILPKRSTRSSRVIKPNKRLLEDGIICQKKNSHTSNQVVANSSSSGSVNKVKTKKEQQTPTQQQLTTPTTAAPQVVPAIVQQNYFGLGSLGAETPNAALGLRSAKETTAEQKMCAFSLTTSAFSSSFGGLGGINMGSLKGNNFVLRQPRLQFDSLSERSNTPTAATVASSALATTTSATTTQPTTFGTNAVLGSTLAGNFSLGATGSTSLLTLSEY